MEKQLTCPACGVYRSGGLTGCILAMYKSSPDEKLMCKCHGCGFTWIQTPLYAARDEEKETDD